MYFHHLSKTLPFFPGWHFCSLIQKVKVTSAVLVWALYKQRVSKFNKCLLELVKKVINTGAQRAPSASNVWHQASGLFIFSTWLSNFSCEGRACGVNALTGIYLRPDCVLISPERLGEGLSTRAGTGGRSLSVGARWRRNKDWKDSIIYWGQWHRGVVSSPFLSRWQLRSEGLNYLPKVIHVASKGCHFASVLPQVQAVIP